MRPIRLIMQAFGAYAGRQELDFGRLGDRSLFLICGPTGSGKTTILDAICFALYGETSSPDRAPRQMRSDHQPDGAATCVQFEFSLGDRRYHIERSPEQQRPKLRGQGFTQQPAEATLTAIPVDAPPRVLATGWSRVTEQTERLLGFRSEQFRQVVVLPQGRFRELLVASSSQREDILQTLFGTQIYERMQETLRREARELEVQLRKLDDRCNVILEQAGAASTEALERRREFESRATADAARRTGQLAHAEQSARRAWNDAQAVQDRFEEHDAALAMLKRLELRQPEIAAQQTELDRALKAAGLMDAERAWQDRHRESEQAQQQLREAAMAVERAAAAHQAAQDTLVREQAHGPQRDRLRRELAALDALVERAGQLSEARAAAVAAEHDADAKSHARAELAARLKQADDRKEAGRKELMEASAQAAQMQARQMEVRDWEDRLRECRRLEELKRHQDGQRHVLNRAITSAQAAEAAYQGARQELVAMETIWRAGHAAVLAASLAAGEPCPVCGSREHPRPAVAGRELPGDEAIESRRMEVDHLMTQRDEARKSEAGHRAQLSAAEAAYAELAGRLGEWGRLRIEELSSRVAEARKAVEQAVTARRRADRLSEDLAGLDASINQDREALTRADDVLAAALAQRDRRRGEVHALEGAMPEELRAAGALDRTRAAAAERLRAAETAVEAAREAAARAEQQLARCNATVESATAGAERCVRLAEAARSEFEGRLATAGLRDADDYAAARRTRAQAAGLEASIKEYQGLLADARGRCRRAEAAIEGFTLPGVAELAARAERIANIATRALRRETTLAERSSRTRQALDQLGETSRQRDQLTRRFGVIGRLAEVANGDNAGRLTFQRFVLSAVLDEVLLAASSRLRLMSKGRFTLRRAGEPGDARRTGGLDLEVEDAYTGTARAVATLSGGESFQAALSLALGMAQVVQSYAGGTRLDAVFIDEGFGSLDPEALDLALNTLIDLRRDGRLVGVISHVPELREFIDTRLEVTAGRAGSRAAFVVP